MHGFSLRRQLVALVSTTALATALVVLGGASPAHAAAGASLQFKASGTLYTPNEQVILGVVPGKTLNVSLKIVNSGTAYQHFKVSHSAPATGLAVDLRTGTTSLPKPTYTTALQPGASQVLTLRIAVSPTFPVGQTTVRVDVRDPATNVELDYLFVDMFVTQQSGHLRNDLFIKTGTQPYVGGSDIGGETSSAVKVGATATFSLRLQNNGATTVPTIKLARTNVSTPCPNNYVLTVKKGYTDVTAAVANGTFSTGPLAPGAKVDLKASVKRVGTTPGCHSGGVYFTATGPDGSVLVLGHIPNAA